MIYKIVYDKNTRLRVRVGRDIFTREEGYGLFETLSKYDFIDEVSISHKNGSILILYNDVNKKAEILKILDKISKDDLFDGKATDEIKSKEISDNFFMNLAKKILKRYLFEIIYKN
ncbi:hypothetical protein [uncultured Methanobrevibacter sp.]|uniref:hypothetical protein n=1 Tax=uncultured Methanobrevibacter sp. TaxID=253161 RepID=UPI0025D211A9|nr:hypothetical protein [uncultured Methanobrevibacter sp.]